MGQSRDKLQGEALTHVGHAANLGSAKHPELLRDCGCLSKSMILLLYEGVHKHVVPQCAV